MQAWQQGRRSGEGEPASYRSGGSGAGCSGVVFGDIGTSPLYTVQTVFNPGDPHPVKVSAENVFGVVSLIFWSVTITRHRADVSMAPATCLSQVLLFAVCAPFSSISGMHGVNLGYVALLDIVQMGLGLVFISLGARLIPAAEVALITQLENVLGPLWVWLAGIEHPSAPTIAGGVVVIGAVIVQITGRQPARLPRPADELTVTGRVEADGCGRRERLTSEVTGRIQNRDLPRRHRRLPRTGTSQRS